MCRLWENGRCNWKASGCLWSVLLKHSKCYLSATKQCNDHFCHILHSKTYITLWHKSLLVAIRMRQLKIPGDFCNMKLLSLALVCERISQPGKYAGIAGMIDILQGLGVRSWFQLSFTLLMVIPSLKLRLFSPCYFCWQSYDVQAFGSWSPHSFHAHWAGAQLQELPPCSVTFLVNWAKNQRES